MNEELLLVFSYAVYLMVSLGLTVWVARTLYKNGRIFLVQAFDQNVPLADSVNHLLVVGFYLINLGYVSLQLKQGVRPISIAESIEALSVKLGFVLVVLGLMHFFNIFVFNSFRKRHAEQRVRD